MNLNDQEFEIYKQAVEQGSADSCFNLGSMYANRGSDFYHEAIMWYRNAANQGHIQAQRVLKEIKKNKDKPAPWYKKNWLSGLLSKLFN